MKILKGIFLLIFSLILLLAVRQYFFCPRYNLSAGQPFSGNNWYNPYEGMDSLNWVKSNFHAHTRAWMGITNGKGTAEDVWNAYQKLGYGIHCVSDYEKINATFQDKPNYISAYEHGYNLLKTHQLVVGDEDVVGLDYFFPQTQSNKQDLLRRLSANRQNLVIINHPSVRNGYHKEDFAYLSNYHCMEIASPYQRSPTYWDAALSAGKPIFAVANDDIHNIFNSRGIGRFFTFVNTTEINRSKVLDAYKKGRHITIIAADIREESDQARTERLRFKMPVLNSFKFENDSLLVRFSAKPVSVKFIGQSGTLLKTVLNSQVVNYWVKNDDTYLRTEAEFEDGTLMYLNPIFRYSDPQPLERNFVNAFQINSTQTFLLRLLGTAVLALWVALLFKSLFARRKTSD